MKWLSRKPTIIVTAVSVVVVLAAAVVLRNVSSSRTFQFFGELVHRVETTEKVVALTFDDGPDPAGTQQTLDILNEKQVPATFFLMGRDLQKYPGSWVGRSRTRGTRSATTATRTSGWSG